MGEAALAIRGLTVTYDRDPVLVDIDASFGQGRVVGIVGPNGAGKSTLIKAALGLLPKDSGTIRAFGKQVREVRDRIVYVPQRSTIDWDFPVTVRDVVKMGRYGRIPWWKRASPNDRKAVDAALAELGIDDLGTRHIGDLSGGQQQRTFLARALAQGGDIYLLDEPLVGVDAATEATIMATLSRLRDEGATVVVVHHDLGSVTRYFDDLLLLNREVIAAGPVADVFTTESLQLAYGGRLTFIGEGANAAVIQQ